jgi:two-component system cell cycle response regulator
LKVLLAHRSEAVRDQTRQVFEELGWTLLAAGDGLEAERVCRAERPDVAVLQRDIGWSRHDGTLVEHLRSDSELRRIKLVLLSGELELAEAMDGLERGIDHVVEPVSASELAVRVKLAERLGSLEARLDDHLAEVRDVLHADPVTGLLDRRFMVRQLDAQVSAARRHGHRLSVLLVDLDRLKEINDSRGHNAGDDALRAVAIVLGERLRSTDTAGRWGGDEFLVVLPDTDAEAAMKVAEALLEGVRELGPGSPPVTLSVGCAEWQEDDPLELVKRADAALYAVKNSGRDGVALAADRELEIPTPATPTVAGHKGLRVLVVDDVESIRALLRITLESLGMKLAGEAGDGTEAVETARSVKPDVVVMDWNMPGRDGIQATRELLRALPGTRIVAFTSTDDPRIHRALFEAGVVAHFNKREISALMQFLAELAPAALDPGAASARP